MATGQRSDKSDAERRKDALKWLSIVRQAKVDRETVVAYELGLVDVPGWAVERACKDIGSVARGEYETAWPELGAIRSRALTVERVENERRQSARLLNAAPPEPVAPEKLQRFMSQIRQFCKKRVMP